MEENIFMAEKRPVTLEDYLWFDAESRGNLGGTLPVSVYRLLEYSMKGELAERFGVEAQIDIFRSAGRRAGVWFAEHLLNLDQPLGSFVSELQAKLQTYKIGILRVEFLDEESGKFILTVAEDADCSGLPVLGETVCNYDEGFIAGILSRFTGKPYTAVEVDCWATGDRVCRFRAEICDGNGGAQ